MFLRVRLDWFYFQNKTVENIPRQSTWENQCFSKKQLRVATEFDRDIRNRANRSRFNAVNAGGNDNVAQFMYIINNLMNHNYRSCSYYIWFSPRKPTVYYQNISKR